MVSGDILFFVDFIKTELIPKKYNYLGMQGELEMTKEKLAKELMVKWLLGVFAHPPKKGNKTKYTN
ncbi:hypothetical protein [Bacillus paranthracis]|uniref:hypothetical protein n=1 Tax=Bacillus paranthracis TaxID=2026186 RepID=UPI0013D2247D|nr:hypothetical protein [Bacillus paranthracis]